MREMPYIQPYHVGNRRGGNIDNKVFESAITFWFKDVDFDGDKVWEYFHINN